MNSKLTKTKKPTNSLMSKANQKDKPAENKVQTSGNASVEAKSQDKMKQNLHKIYNFTLSLFDELLSLKVKAAKGMDELYLNSGITSSDVYWGNENFFPGEIISPFLKKNPPTIDSSPFSKELFGIYHITLRLQEELHSLLTTIEPLMDEIKTLFFTEKEEAHLDKLGLFELMSRTNYICKLIESKPKNLN